MGDGVAVVYKTKYGSAAKYARWIANEVKADIFERSLVEIEDLMKYDTIVYGGSLYAVGILGFDLIKKNFDLIKNKNIIIFTVGASPAHDSALEDIRNGNFTDEIKKKVKHFHFRGAFDYSTLSFGDKLMMLLLKKRLQFKKELNKDEKGMLASYEKPMNWTNKNTIKPLVEYIMKNMKD
jgi:menaquinone-dependent protoporphyrinogen IX oxidase